LVSNCNLLVVLLFDEIILLFLNFNSAPRTGKTWLTNNTNRFNFRPSHSIESVFFGNAVIKNITEFCCTYNRKTFNFNVVSINLYSCL